MSISSSLNSGVAGLMSNATRLATISDNIANSSTYGYKRVQTDFHSMVISQVGGSYSAGGVRTTTQRLIDQKGALVSTSNPTDLAVSGRGMLPVTTMNEVENANGAEQLYLTSTGSFRTNAEGYLTTESGLALLGWPALPDGTIPTYPRDSSNALEPVQINLNQFSGEATTEISLGVNLPATATGATSAGTPSEMSVEYYDNLGTSQSLNIEFTPTIPVSGSSNEWTMVITDSASAGAIVGEYTLEFDDSRTTGGSLLNVTTISGGAYDALTGGLIVNVAGGPVEINIGAVGTSDGLTQLSDSFAPVAVIKDGYPVGNLTSVEVDGNGLVHAYFDTGINRTIYQIPLVDFPNVNGLAAGSQQTYLPTPDSGSFFLWDAGDGTLGNPTGSISSFALEESTTDVAEELTSMIETQRAYSSNAKVIQTVDEMLQETTNIKR